MIQTSWVVDGFLAGITDYSEDVDRTLFTAACGGNCGWCQPSPQLFLGVDADTSGYTHDY